MEQREIFKGSFSFHSRSSIHKTLEALEQASLTSQKQIKAWQRARSNLLSVLKAELESRFPDSQSRFCFCLPGSTLTLCVCDPCNHQPVRHWSPIVLSFTSQLSQKSSKLISSQKWSPCLFEHFTVEQVMTELMKSTFNGNIFLPYS